jgi:hypothetical protein
MLFRLALAMGRTVGDLGAAMDSAELTEWLAFYDLEPWGCGVEDARTALVACLLANQWKGKDDKPAAFEDFLPDRGGERAARQVRPEDMTPEEIEEHNARFLAAFSTGNRKRG